MNKRNDERRNQTLNRYDSTDKKRAGRQRRHFHTDAPAMAGASQDRTKSLGHDAQQETATTAGGGLDLRTLLHRCLRFSGSPVNTCVRLQIVIEEKTGKTLFDVYGSSRAFATSAMGPSLRASSHALPIPLVTSLSLLQTSKKNIGSTNLKNKFFQGKP